VCEYFYTKGLFKQPNSTFTNVFFLFFGILILLWKPESSTNNNLMTANRALPVFFGSLVIATFLGSSFYHSSVLVIAAYCDMFGVYSVAFFIFYYQLTKFYCLSKNPSNFVLNKKELFVFFLLVLSSTLLFDICFKDAPNPVILVYFGILSTFVISAFKTSFRIKKNYLTLTVLFSLFGIFSFFCDHHVCYQTSLIQGHSLWHIFSAACVYSVFMIFSTEQSP